MKYNFKILSSEEEKNLTHDELINYYKELKDYLLKKKYSSSQLISLKINFLLNYIIKKILKMFCGYEIIVDINENINGLLGIYAHTHQSKFDHINFIVSNPNHTILLNSSVLNNFYKKILSLNGVVYVNKLNKISKKKAKLELMRLLLNGKSVTMFPESAWNCSPNKLHLPLFIGMIDIAKKIQIPIIPVVQEYIYDEEKKDGRERIKKVYIKYGKPIYVKTTDDNYDKLQEYSEQVSTIRWELIEKKGVFKRKDINNDIYINYLKGNIRNLKNAGIDIDVEKKGIFGSDEDFYLFHYINAVDFDENKELLPTEHVRKLIKLFDENKK